MRRLLILLPFAAGIAVLIGGNFAWAGIAAFAKGNRLFGGIFLMYGMGGIILGVSLWRAYRQFRRKAGTLEPGPPAAD